MSLFPCRACSHEVDDSALACPQCGATDPARKISRQQRDLRIFLVQALVGAVVFGAVAWVVWHEFLPTIKAIVGKSAG